MICIFKGLYSVVSNIYIKRFNVHKLKGWYTFSLHLLKLLAYYFYSASVIVIQGLGLYSDQN